MASRSPTAGRGAPSRLGLVDSLNTEEGPSSASGRVEAGIGRGTSLAGRSTDARRAGRSWAKMSDGDGALAKV
jgi:hypothetical protein